MLLRALGEALVDPAVPVVDPAAELVDDPVELLPIVAFVKMNDAPEPDPDGVRDAVAPDVDPLVVAPVVPVVPAVLPISPRCRQPTTVIVPG